MSACCCAFCSINPEVAVAAPALLRSARFTAVSCARNAWPLLRACVYKVRACSINTEVLTSVVSDQAAVH